jgi:hypothetical protein
MTQSRFFQLSLFFPLILWFLGLLVFSFVNKEGYAFIIKHMFDAVRVFVPYLLFAAGVWRLASNKPHRILILIAFVAPIIWGFFFTVCYYLNAIVTDQVRDLKVLLMMAFWATVVAYLAEAIPHIILTIFKNDFRPEAAEVIGEASPAERSLSPES